MTPARSSRSLATLAAAGLVALLSLLALAVIAGAAKDNLILISRADGPGGVGGDGRSYDVSTSGDGRYVAFISEAENLSDQDAPGLDLRLLG